jgi:WD40 repeat protein
MLPGYVQAHEAAVRAMTFTHDERYLITADDNGTLKYWKPQLELLAVFSGHKEPVRSVTFAPTDVKFATASDDSTVKASAPPEALLPQKILLLVVEWGPNTLFCCMPVG